jgi:hypothetical protein
MHQRLLIRFLLLTEALALSNTNTPAFWGLTINFQPPVLNIVDPRSIQSKKEIVTDTGKPIAGARNKENARASPRL